MVRFLRDALKNLKIHLKCHHDESHVTLNPKPYTLNPSISFSSYLLSLDP